MILTGGKQKYSRKTSPVDAILSTINLTRAGLGLNLGLRSEGMGS